MGRITYDRLIALQQQPRNIRNVSIVAHVDHGKTCISDLLLADNAIFSKKQAGRLRYLDNRRDEQNRGITMKSSMFSLHFHDKRANEDYLMNLIDSPGHIDFTSEVSAATRISDGVFIVVDTVEGVQPQTITCLELAIRDECKMVLVLNKIDKLIIERGLEPRDIHLVLGQLIESINASISAIRYKEKQARLDEIDEYEDSEFDPRLGNVIFASAVDGWAFRLIDFANIQTVNVATSPDELETMLWGDFYYNGITKTIHKGAGERNKKCLFVSLILDNIAQMYENVLLIKDAEKINNMITKLGLHPNKHDMASMYCRTQLRALISEWLPLSTVFYETMVEKMPSPLAISSGKVRRVMQVQNLHEDDRPFSDDLQLPVSTCNYRGPVLGYIAKVFPILPQNKMEASIQKSGAMSDIATRREKCRLIKAAQVRLAIEKAQDALNEVAELSRDASLQLDQSSIELLRTTFPRITDKRSLTSTPFETPTPSLQNVRSNPSLGLISFLSEPLSSDVDIPTSGSISQENLKSDTDLSLPASSSASKIDFGKSNETFNPTPITLEAKPSPTLITLVAEPTNSDIDLTTSSSVSQENLKSESSQGDLNQFVASSVDDPATLSQVMERVEKMKLHHNGSGEKPFSIPGCQHEVIAMVRIFAGTLKRGSNLYLINPTHSPALLNKAGTPEMIHHIMQTVKKFPVEELFMILGKDVVDIDSAPAGNIVGLGQLHKYGITVRSGTVASTLDCNPLIESHESTDPFFKCCITPKNIDEYPILAAGLKMLTQTDSCVQCILQENGEYIIVTAGHVHLDKCVEDLSLFTGIEFVLSQPTVNLRESLMPRVYEPPARGTVTRSPELTAYDIKMDTHAHPMPEALQDILRTNHVILKTFQNIPRNDPGKFNILKNSALGSRVISSIQTFFDSMAHENMTWDADRIIAVGNSKEDCCLLINLSKKKRIGSLFEYREFPEHTTAIVQLLKNAFQLAIRAGPLCDEPVKNVIFIILDIFIDRRIGSSMLSLHSGPIQNAFKKALLRPMRAMMPRLCEPIYGAKVTLDNSVLGKLSHCIDQHRGRIIQCFTIARGVTDIQFHMPVLESTEFSENLRKATQGVVNPLLEFSHYEMIHECPLAEAIPTNKTEYELQAYYEARKIMNDVRRRKGLVLDEKIVSSAEKQRTLNKKK